MPVLLILCENIRDKTVKEMKESYRCQSAKITREGDFSKASLEQKDGFHQMETDSHRIISPEGSLV